MREETIAYAKEQGRYAYLFQESELAYKYSRDANQYIALYWENGEHLFEINACFDQGWQEAEQEEREQGRVGVLLGELAERLDTCDEWYGSDFEVPLYLAREALKAYKASKNAS